MDHSTQGFQPLSAMSDEEDAYIDSLSSEESSEYQPAFSSSNGRAARAHNQRKMPVYKPKDKNTGRASKRKASANGHDPSKRDHHNELERERRNQIKQSFHNLQGCVPQLAGKEKPSRALILTLATQYINSMLSKNKKVDDEISNLRNENEMLESKYDCITAKAPQVLMLQTAAQLDGGSLVPELESSSGSEAEEPDYYSPPPPNKRIRR